MKPLAIIGLSPESHEQAPWGDESWERWGVGSDAYAPRCHFLFEMHPPERVFRDDWNGEKYRAKLHDMDIPTYVQGPIPGVLFSVEYPLKQVVASIGRDYFGSSVAYMLALAIHQKRARVGIWGVDLTNGHDHQKHNLAWLIGLAMGRGMTFDDTESLCAILSYDPNANKRMTYPTRYGYIQ